jgi:hypothetical protein
MTALPPDVDFQVDKSASSERMNRAMAHIVARLKALETYRPNFDALLAELQQVGLDRINDGILPVYQHLLDIEALGFLNSPIEDGTPASFALGNVSVRISADRRSAFTPSPWVMMVRDANYDDYVLARRISYDRTTGLLSLHVTNLWGSSGTYSDVTVWGVAGGAISSLESAAQVASNRAAVEAAKTGADADAAATAADRAAVHNDRLAADTDAANAAASANAAATSAAEAAASAASIAGGPVASINGRTGIVTLSTSDVSDALGYSPANKAGDSYSGVFYSTGSLGIGSSNPPAEYAIGSNFVYRQNKDAASVALFINETIGAGAAIGTELIGGTAYSYVSNYLIDNNGSPHVVEDVGSAITYREWRSPIFVWTSSFGTTEYGRLDGTAFRLAANTHLNFGGASGSSGYGIRDKAGTIEIKAGGGAWAKPAPFDAMAYQNIVFNGAMEVSQFNGASAVANINGYLLDGWIVGKSGTMAVSAQQVTDAPPGFSNSLKVSVTTAEAALGASDYFVIAQPVEGIRWRHGAWGTSSAYPVSIGFWFKASITGTFCVSITNAAGNRSIITTFAYTFANNWQWVAIANIPGDATGAWAVGNTIGCWVRICLAAGSGYQGDPGWQAGNILSTPIQTNGAAIIGNTFQLTGVVILPGAELPNSADAWKCCRQFDDELRICQRYYEKSYNLGDVPGTAGVSGYWTSVAINTMEFYDLGHMSFSVRKRGTPAMTGFSFSGVQGAFYDGNYGSNNGNAGFANVSESGARIYCINAALAANHISMLHWVADARL